MNAAPQESHKSRYTARHFFSNETFAMALSATPYKVDVNLTDLDRSVFETLRFTVARHPSETEERLCARLIAYVLWYSESLAFGRGVIGCRRTPPYGEKKKPGMTECCTGSRSVYPTPSVLIWCSRRAERGVPASVWPRRYLGE